MCCMWSKIIPSAKKCLWRRTCLVSLIVALNHKNEQLIFSMERGFVFFFPQKAMRANWFYLHLPVFLVASFISWSLTFLDQKAFFHHLLMPTAFFFSPFLFFPLNVHPTGEVSENQTLDGERLLHLKGTTRWSIFLCN